MSSTNLNNQSEQYLTVMLGIKSWDDVKAVFSLSRWSEAVGVEHFLFRFAVMGNSVEQWRSAIGGFNPIRAAGISNSHTADCGTRVKHTDQTISPPYKSLAVITLLLVIGGIELNPGPRIEKDTKDTDHTRVMSADKRLELDTSEIDFKGDCLFKSLADQLMLLTSFRMNNHELRDHLVSYIRGHPTQPNCDHVMALFDADKNEPWQTYLSARDLSATDDIYDVQLVWYTSEYMTDSTVWGDNVILYAFTQLYNMDVVVHIAGVDEPYIMTGENGNQERKQAKLGYIPQLKFVSLVEKKDNVHQTRKLLTDFIVESQKYVKLEDNKTENDVHDVPQMTKMNEKAISDSDNVKGEQIPTLPSNIVKESLKQRLEERGNALREKLYSEGSQAIQKDLNQRKDAASHSAGQTILEELKDYHTLCAVNKCTDSDETHQNGIIQQLRMLLEILIKEKEEEKPDVKTKTPLIDYIPEDCVNDEATPAMYELGKQITKCNENDELSKQARLMVQLGNMYADLAKKTKEGWHFVWASTLYNAALHRINKDKSSVDYANEPSAYEINDALQQLETNFLLLVAKVSKGQDESPKDYTRRYKETLTKLREYSNETVNNIHTNDMQLDSETFDMTKDSEISMIKHSKKFYEELTCKIKGFHSLLMDECISVMGKPDCRYAWIGLGSLARKEATAWSDLESAIIFDPSGKTDEEIEKIKQYFRDLVHYLHLKVINLGETLVNGLDIPVLKDWNSKLPKGVKDNDFRDNVTPQGLCFDGTPPKASKTPHGRRSTKDPLKSSIFELIMTLDEMSNCQFEEVSMREGYNLSDVLLTSTFLHGDDLLWKEYNEKVHAIMRSPSIKSSLKLSVSKERGKVTLRDDLKKYFQDPLLPEAFNRDVRTKHRIYRFATISINILKLLHLCVEFSPLDILEELHKMRVLTERAKIDLQVMVCIATNLRHLVYGRFGRQHENISFVLPTNTGPNSSDMISVRDYTEIFRFYSTLIPWSEFLLNRFCFDDILTCKYESKYKDISRLTNAGLQEQMYMTQKAIESLLQEERSQSDSENNREKLLDIRNRLARLYYSNGEYDKAIKYLEDCHAMEKVTHGNNSHPDVAIAVGSIGKLYDNKGEYDKAIKYSEESLSMFREIHGNNPHQDIAILLGNIGDIYTRKAEYDKAIEYNERSLTMKQVIHGNKPHQDITDTLGNIGNAYASKGEYDIAIKYHEKSLSMLEELYGNNPHPKIALVLGNIVYACTSKGEYDKAIGYCEESLAMKKVIYGEDYPHPAIASTLGNIGSVYGCKGENDKALKYYQEKLDMEREIYGNGPHPDIANSYGCIGHSFCEKGDVVKGLIYCKRSLDMFKQIYGDNAHPNIGTTLNTIGCLYLDTQQYSEALDCFNEAYHVFEKIYGNNTHIHLETVLDHIRQTKERLRRCTLITNEVSSFFDNQ
ncbi:unnamed protein product [Owenia fusiformis]|uniref:Protein-PII uridylyltransferase N-terminal domain-containing protein n=1 Tax=Owenia fusiformis TaxID=6347 RepID=A0A8S4N6Q2_OWEFU|nr:unnamed protein product [Owenia fusiformis]